MKIKTSKPNRIGLTVQVAGIPVKFDEKLEAEVTQEEFDAISKKDSSISLVDEDEGDDSKGPKEEEKGPKVETKDDSDLDKGSKNEPLINEPKEEEKGPKEETPKEGEASEEPKVEVPAEVGKEAVLEQGSEDTKEEAPALEQKSEDGKEEPKEEVPAKEESKSEEAPENSSSEENTMSEEEIDKSFTANELRDILKEKGIDEKEWKKVNKPELVKLVKKHL